MARRKAQKSQDDDASLLDVIDSVLNRGAVVDGDLILGVANVDLIYAKLSVVLAAVDRALQPVSRGRRARQRPDRQKRLPSIKNK